MKKLYRFFDVFFTRYYYPIYLHMLSILATVLILALPFGIERIIGIVCCMLNILAFVGMSAHKNGTTEPNTRDYFLIMLMEDYSEEEADRKFRTAGLTVALIFLPLAIITYFIWAGFAIASLF